MTPERHYPKIAAYHCGPYRLAAILQDPGTRHGSRSGANKTGEVGVLNDDPTANLLKLALDEWGVPHTGYLPLNAVPWYDAPRSKNKTLLKEGAEYNRNLIIFYNIKLVLLLGGDARRSEPMLNLAGDVEVRKLPHPGRLGLINYRENGVRIGAAAARQRVIEGFKCP